ncbi:MAG: PGF-pre-PGF domain-containing protein, partial [Candidatus Aenigmarchaeota archaeon]|nr:PGF-pre-PGF domain-containing protein [Candidatus Aenigmarchaeota archaeon]
MHYNKVDGDAVKIFVLLLASILLLPGMALAQSVAVLVPNGGEAIAAGANTSINWSASGSIDHFHVSYTTDSSAACSGFAESGCTNQSNWFCVQHPASGNVTWTTPMVNSSTVRVQVTALNASNASLAYDCADANFTVASLPTAPGSLQADTLNSTAINVSWTAGQGLVSLYTVFRNGNPAGNASNTSLSYVDVGLTALTNYTYFVRAYNPVGYSPASGNASNSTASDAFPNATNVAPIAAYNSSNASIVFACLVTDDIGLANVSLYGNWSSGWHANQSSAATGTGNASNFTVAGIADGTYIWACLAYDSIGNYTFAPNRTVTVDTTGPNVTLLTPANLSTWNASHTVIFSYNVSDSVAMASCTLHLDGTANSSSSAVSKTATNSLNATMPDGDHSWLVSCTDSLGNVGNSSRFNVSVSADDAPNVTLSSPVDGFNTSSASATFNCSVTDDYAIANVSLYINSTGTWHANQTAGLTGTANSTTLTVSGLADGQYLWNCLAYDTAGNYSFATANRTFTRDTAVPSAVTNFTNITTAANWVMLNWTNPANADFNGTMLYRNGTNAANLTRGVTSYNMSGLNSSTDYNFSIQTFDTAGNVNNSLVSVLVRTALPSITFGSPPSGSYASGSNVSFSWSSDGVVHYRLCYTSIGGGPSCPATGTGNSSRCETLGWTSMKADNVNQTSYSCLPGSSNCLPSTAATGYRVMVAGFNESDYFVAAACSSNFTISAAASGASSGASSGTSSGQTAQKSQDAAANTSTTTTTDTPATVTETVVSEGTTKRLDKIAAGASGTVSFDSGDIRQIIVAAQNDTEAMDVAVQQYAAKPEAVPELNSTVYRYLEIKAGASANIASAAIRFVVQASWLAENQLGSGAVALFRYNGSAWQ